MTTVLFRPLPLPVEGVRPGVGLLVLAFHVALLCLANLYWPLQTVLLGAMQDTVQNVTVQIFQKTPERSKPDEGDTLTTKQAITNPGRQRLGRSEAMLALPPAQTTSSTPLAGTAQSVQTAPPRAVVVTKPLPAVLTAALATSAARAAQAQPLPTNEVAIAPAVKPVTPAVVRSLDDVLPEPAPTKPPTATTPPVPSPPPAAPLPVVPPVAVTASAPPAAPVAPVASVVPAAPAAVEATPVITPSAANTAVTSNASGSSSTGTASGAAQASGVGSIAAGSPQGTVAAPVTPSTTAGAPLNLNLPPRYIYRPPLSLPRRSLADMANDQLRRKPRDAFAESMESAGSIDCLKNAPDGAAQGLLAIGPLLKRAIEEKCRK